MLSVKTNLLAANADRQLRTNTKKNAKLAEKLSSGYRINRAADDAAGLAISEKMRRQIRGLHQSVDNINDGIGYVQTAEGALNEVHDMLQRINELAVKSANGTNTEEDRSYIDSEVQAIKKEIDRIFDETAFNERIIWDPDEIESPNGGKEALVTGEYTSKDIFLTNDNYEVLPINTQQTYTTVPESRYCEGTFKVNAKEDGITVEWEGYDKKHYETTKISWADLKDKGYRFDISEYFDKSQTKLFDSQGAPVFSYEIAFKPSDEARVKDICDAIDQKRIKVYTYTNIQGSWEDGTSNSNGFTLNGSLNYWAVCESRESSEQNKHSFGDDDLFLEPVKTNGTNLISYPTCTEVDDAKTGDGWSFALKLEGIGDVTATSTQICYYSTNLVPEDEGTWWVTQYTSSGYPYPATIYRYPAGTLAGVMDALDGANGLLSPPSKDTPDPSYRGNHNGNTGRINIGFRLNATDGREVGVCTLSFDVSKNDTMKDVLDRINGALNGNTILDFATVIDPEYTREHSWVDSLDPTTEYIDTTKGFCNFFVQAGAEAGQHIDIRYEALSIYVLKMHSTNVLTVEDSDAAINEIKYAMEVVSKQRSDFGAYQNRLEHAVNINQNVEENTQAAESLIRDTDIAEKMMEYSVNNILLQAGTSMLTQANQSKQLVLELLN